MEEKRKVVVYEYQKVKGQIPYEKVAVGNGIFHKWGIGYEEFETGPGNYSTAIIEMPDGSVKNVPVENIVFNIYDLATEANIPGPTHPGKESGGG